MLAKHIVVGSGGNLATGPKVEKFSESGDKKRFVEYTISENFGGDANELIGAVLGVYAEASQEMMSNRGGPNTEPREAPRRNS